MQALSAYRAAVIAGFNFPIGVDMFECFFHQDHRFGNIDPLRFRKLLAYHPIDLIEHQLRCLEIENFEQVDQILVLPDQVIGIEFPARVTGVLFDLAAARFDHFVDTCCKRPIRCTVDPRGTDNGLHHAFAVHQRRNRRDDFLYLTGIAWARIIEAVDIVVQFQKTGGDSFANLAEMARVDLFITITLIKRFHRFLQGVAKLRGNVFAQQRQSTADFGELFAKYFDAP